MSSGLNIFDAFFYIFFNIDTVQVHPSQIVLAHPVPKFFGFHKVFIGGTKIFFYAKAVEVHISNVRVCIWNFFIDRQSETGKCLSIILVNIKTIQIHKSKTIIQFIIFIFICIFYYIVCRFILFSINIHIDI